MTQFDPDEAMASAMGLVLRDMITVAEDALRDAQLLHREAETAVMAAETDLEEARAVPSRLATQAATGELATSRTVAKALAAVQEAGDYRIYCAEVMRLRAENVEHARAALQDARHYAHLPMLQRGQDLRIQAGEMCDAARRFTSHIGQATPLDEVEAANARRRAAVDAARPLWEAGSAIVDAACKGGARLPSDAGWIPDQWPTTEQAERRHWRRPLAVETLEAAHAAA